MAETTGDHECMYVHVCIEVRTYVHVHIYTCVGMWGRQERDHCKKKFLPYCYTCTGTVKKLALYSE